MPGFAETEKLVAFTDALPGSVIAFTGLGFFKEEATVIEMKREFGPTSIPALIVQVKSTGDQRLLTANGDTQIKILLDARNVMTEQLPEIAVQARLRPVPVVAIEFTGGIGIAMACIQWAAGHVAIQYRADDDNYDEAILVTSLNGIQECKPGDWLVRDELGDFNVVGQSAFARHYDVIPRVI